MGTGRKGCRKLFATFVAGLSVAPVNIQYCTLVQSPTGQYVLLILLLIKCNLYHSAHNTLQHSDVHQSLDTN